MDESERQEYIREVERDSSTIGADLPETVDVGGDELQLTEFLVETRKLEEVPPEAAETVETAKRVLREERRQRVDRLESDPISHETAERLVDEINGFDRALNALETIRHPSFGDVAQRTMVDDYERWLGFLDTVQG
jgi:hypothetical protein